MDPVALATAATTLLVPYLAKAAPYLKIAGEKLAEEIGSKLPEQVGKLWESIEAKFKGRPAAEEAAKDFVAHPDDEDNKAAFRKELKKALSEDMSFATELEGLLQASGAASILSVGSGAIATHGGVAAGEGGVAVGGDVHGSIGVGSHPKDRKQSETQ